MNLSDVMVGDKVELADGTVARVDTVAHGWVELAGVSQKYRASALWPVGTTDEEAAAATAEQDEEQDEEQEGRLTPVLHFDLSRYASGLAKTPSGRNTIDTGDYVAALLRGLSIDALYAEAARFMRCYDGDEAATEEQLRARYGHLNIGMQRMNLGNRMRGVYGRHLDRLAAERRAAESI